MYRGWSAEIQRRSEICAYTRYFRAPTSMHCSRLCVGVLQGVNVTNSQEKFARRIGGSERANVTLHENYKIYQTMDLPRYFVAVTLGGDPRSICAESRCHFLLKFQWKA